MKNAMNVTADAAQREGDRDAGEQRDKRRPAIEQADGERGHGVTATPHPNLPHKGEGMFT